MLEKLTGSLEFGLKQNGSPDHPMRSIVFFNLLLKNRTTFPIFIFFSSNSSVAIIFTVATDAEANGIGDSIKQFVLKYYHKIVNKVERVFDNVVATDAQKVGGKISQFTLKLYEVFGIESVLFSRDDSRNCFDRRNVLRKPVEM